MTKSITSRSSFSWSHKGKVLGTIAALALGLAASGMAAPPAPGPAGQATERNITKLTVSLLEHSQFAHHPLDRECANTFLDRYLDARDGSRSLSLQADVDEFAPLRATLAQTTRDTGDTGPAHVIFARYLQRLEQSETFVSGLLKAGKFEFTGHDTYSFDRAKATRPKDMEAAMELWRQLPRAENLQEIYLIALAHAYDPHSDYLGHVQMESLSIATILSLFGIGASLRPRTAT